MANPLTLESVSTAFDHWRQNRTSRKESVPISLREHAIKLLAHHSKSRVIEALKINHSMLKQWRHKGERSAPTFVVLPPPKPDSPLVEIHGRAEAITHSQRKEMKLGYAIANVSLVTETRYVCKQAFGFETP